MNSQNIGAHITSRFALEATTFGVGVGNLGNTDGEAFQRTSVRPLHLSGKFVATVEATLPSGSSLVITQTMRHSDDGVSYDDLPLATQPGEAGVTTQTKQTTINALDDGSEQKVTVELDFNLIGAKAYVQPRIAGALGTASGSSVVVVAGCLVLGGGETEPPTESAQ